MELSNTTLAFIATIAVFGLVGLVAVDAFTSLQDAEAKACVVGGIGYNASQGRCFQP